MIRIKRGLNIPIQGAPRPVVEDAPTARAVALLGVDYIGIKPSMAVQVGERVKLGQLLFTDKKAAGICYTSPASGVVAAINRGEQRRLQSVVIDVQGDEAVTFPAVDRDNPPAAATIRELLLRSGQWTALRTRPYSKVPAADAEAAAIFVTAIDTHPLAADPALVIGEQAYAFVLGQDLLARLTCGKLYLCTAVGAHIPRGTADNIELAEFSGPHPAGLTGTHIHFLEGVGPGKVVWTIGYQDVIAIGRLFLDGRLYTERVVALGGPQVENPRLLRTRLGVDLQALCAGQLRNGDNRIISGSVLGGRTAYGGLAYLGRYHNQVSVLLEGRHRQFFGWLSPGFNKHSTLGIYVSGFFERGRLLPMDTNTNGSERAMVPVGSYEKVMPMDILPTQLLRALIVGDTQAAQALGCLELDEEDLALCSYVCPGKYEFGPILRDNLTRIEKEG